MTFQSSGRFRAMDVSELWPFRNGSGRCETLWPLRIALAVANQFGRCDTPPVAEVSVERPPELRSSCVGRGSWRIASASSACCRSRTLDHGNARRSLSFRAGATDQSSVRILVAEDTAFWRLKVEEILSATGHEIVWASNGEEACRLLNSDSGIDLVITDWEMPVMNGLELCRRVRSQERAPYLPIILLTSRGARGDLADGLNAGADAFVTKPIHESQLLAQIGVAQRVLQLEENLAAKVRDLTDAKRRLDRDLEAAAAVQRSLLPREAPSIPGLEFAWVYESCEIVGGDLFNVFRLSQDQIGMYILDVSGHGTSAALLSVGLSHVLSPDPQQGGILKRDSGDSGEAVIVPPFEVALELNRRYPLMETSRQYLTFLYGILDLTSLVFRFVRAGHPGPIQIAGGRAVSHDHGGGIPIGIHENVRYRDELIALSPGDSVVFYTDGLSEALSETDEEFGLERILATLSRANGRGIGERVELLRRRIEEFGKGRRLRDDVTMLGLGLA
jgi:sigma-B regulation protein RsbU (phosphoserine phosphatase)